MVRTTQNFHFYLYLLFKAFSNAELETHIQFPEYTDVKSIIEFNWKSSTVFKVFKNKCLFLFMQILG